MSGKSAQATDLRESRRYPCEVPTTCQPPSSWGRDPWPATICDVSNGGLKLRLARRFERGAGLAIELPTEDGGKTTVLARVSHIIADQGGWMLGCSFISELSNEEVNVVLGLDPHNTNGLEDATIVRAALSIHGVLFQACVAGEVVRWYVKCLDLSGAWPLPEGKVVSFRLGGQAGPLAAALIIEKCRLFGSYWIVECRFRDEPTLEVLRTLTTPA